MFKHMRLYDAIERERELVQTKANEQFVACLERTPSAYVIRVRRFRLSKERLCVLPVLMFE